MRKSLKKQKTLEKAEKAWVISVFKPGAIWIGSVELWKAGCF